MSRKRDAPARWPAEVYDYERRVITDAAVGGLDLRKGCWIHCKWCNTTLALKVANSFSLTSWSTHQKGKTHRGHEQEFLGGSSQPQLISCSSQSSVRSSTSTFQNVCRTPTGSQSPQYNQQLIRVGRELHQSKQYQARHERDVANVINAMTSLISDQQGDLDSLHRQVNDMTHEIEALKKDVERLRRQEGQQRRVQSPQKKVVTTTSYTCTAKPESRMIFAGAQGSRNTAGHYRIKPKTQNKNSSCNKRNSVTDMDIFEKRFRLA
ncbi:hypothetical protein PF005_g14796 [Phytophthora fragariae]|uniref:Uncharacterized protein n=1 Tax=Phytophthora fragariae TaxID=53985 RepID=A0A6A3YHP0_9STRA|nr:hypothetical protein PF003_g22639 [Phytophthora fragariae]KAE8933359.1 hypothetical protein PF009_g16644 [Phytophthora fragariae]KAE9000084.1 hypothetical protein PF011_g14350 [Phytophthora fragariae]KAE9100486.1 hypothetical protein PF010_g14804 [Phytophthora fragariae]KAE9100992.1 hypothetical protein PF007_g15317 [Phytophthora fragariae]